MRQERKAKAGEELTKLQQVKQISVRERREEERGGGSRGGEGQNEREEN